MVNDSIIPYFVGLMIGLTTLLGLAIRRRPHGGNNQRAKANSDNDVVEEELLEVENWLHLYGSIPITTLTWYRGNYQAARHLLNSRLQQILEENPWLGGRVKRRGIGKVCLVYNRTGKLKALDFLTTLCASTSPISRTTPLDELPQNCRNLMLCIGRSQPLIKVSLVPCRSNPSQHFALIFAISHVVADGYTYYRLQSMLCGGRKVEALIPKRISSSVRQQSEAMGGRDHYNLIGTWNVGLIVNGILALLRSMTIGPVNTTRYAEVDVRGMAAEKKRAVTQQQAAGELTSVPFVSTNDILTSWFMQNSSCKFGIMTLNWRNRLKGHTEEHAGNYENAIFFRSSDSTSASLVRKSLVAYRRTQTWDSHTVPGLFEMAFSTMAIVTNWASLTEPLGIKDCEQEFHMPLYTAVRNDHPISFALLIIFQATPDKIGLYMVGTPDKLQGLGNPSFLAGNLFEISKPT